MHTNTALQDAFQKLKHLLEISNTEEKRAGS